MMRAGGKTFSHRGFGGVGRSLAALAQRGLLYRRADGRYQLEAPRKTENLPAAAASFISPPTKSQLMAGRAHPRRIGG
jgi:hypothetical protein